MRHARGGRVVKDMGDILPSHCILNEGSGWKGRTDKANVIKCYRKEGVNYNLVLDRRTNTTRFLLAEEEERMMGFPANYTKVGSLTEEERHVLIGNSFFLPVVAFILRPLRDIRNLVGREGEGRRQWCDRCVAANCVCGGGNLGTYRTAEQRLQALRNFGQKKYKLSRDGF